MKLFVFASFLVLATVAFCDARRPPCGRPDSPVGKCPEVNGEMPTYLPDRFNRTVFYECNAGKPIKLRCPPNLVFNPTLSVCDFPREDCVPSGPVGTCPTRDGPYLVFLRDGANMSVFYICNKGEPIKFQCAEGLIFDPKRDSCTRPM